MTKTLHTEILKAALIGFDAQKTAIDARITEVRAMMEPAPIETAAPKKRHMSAAGRKAISDATKRRWAVHAAAHQEPKAKRKLSRSQLAAMRANATKARAAAAKARRTAAKPHNGHARKVLSIAS
jgi:hypothetical protein